MKIKEDYKTKFANSLVQGQELKSTLTKKRKKFVEKTIEKELKEKHFDEGWELLRDNTNSSRIRKEKKHNVLFEDQVWVILAKMGFTTLNADSNLLLPYTKDLSLPGRQTDVFALDDETALIIECKSSEELQKKSLQTIINDFATIKRGAIPFLNEIYPNKRKIKFILATNNIILNENDRKRLEEHQIDHFNQDDITYYEQLTNYLGHASKYQLLGRLFKNNEIPNLKNKVPAIKGKMGSHTFYSFSIEPDTLLKLSYILHSTVTSEDSEGAYQRMVSKSRLNEINNFLDNGGYFPNSIIININTQKEKPLYSDIVSGIHDSETSDLCVLHLPKTYQSAFIIDGQHRLYGYANNEWKFKNSIPVVAFENLPIEEQVKMFVDINHKQKSVSKNLLTTIIADLKWESNIYKDAIFAHHSKLLQRLGERDDSPLYRRIIVGENKKSELTCITLDYPISYGFNKTNLFAKILKNRLVELGPLWVDGYSEMLDKNYEYFKNVFNYIKEECSLNWKKGSLEGGFTAMNIGVLSLIRISDSILQHLKDNESLEPQLTSAKELSELTIRYLSPLTEYLNKLTPQKIKDFRSAGTSGQGRENVVREFQRVIRDRFKNFNPKGFDEWLEDNSGKYNSHSKELVDTLQISIRNHLFNKLKDEFGDERWWSDGVPKETQKRSASEAIERGNHEPHWNFVYLLDYLKIITTNWSVFENSYADPNKEAYENTSKKKMTRKERATKWFSKLNDIRIKVSHPERSAVTETEYNFLTNLSNWLLPRITNTENE
jgi:DNA sulfur modification protein DndB